MKHMNLLPHIFIIAALIVTSGNVFAQQDPSLQATPVVGWDSLKALIAYPEIARRAGLQGYVSVEVEIDSLGNAGEVRTVGYQIFRHSIEKAVKSVLWYPGSLERVPRPVTSYFEVQYHLSQLQHMPKRKVLIIESDRAKVEISH